MVQLQVKLTSCTLMKKTTHKYLFPTSPAEIDYINATTTLMFDATISTQMVTVFVLNDNVVEDTEFINLALTSVDSAVMLNPATARINIDDMGSKLNMDNTQTFVLLVIILTYVLYICHSLHKSQAISVLICLYSSYSMGI